MAQRFIRAIHYTTMLPLLTFILAGLRGPLSARDAGDNPTLRPMAAASSAAVAPCSPTGEGQ
jgi:hypothetical protein